MATPEKSSAGNTLSIRRVAVEELPGEGPAHPAGGAGAPREGAAGEVVGGDPLLDRGAGDGVAGGGAPVARHDDTTVEANGEHRGAVGDLDGRRDRRVFQRRA